MPYVLPRLPKPPATATFSLFERRRLERNRVHAIRVFFPAVGMTHYISVMLKSNWLEWLRYGIRLYYAAEFIRTCTSMPFFVTNANYTSSINFYC